MLPQAILNRIRARVICTTDDPSDDLGYHRMAEGIDGMRFLPTFRPDAYCNIFSDDWRSNVERICQFTGEDKTLQGLVEALRKKDVLARSLIISHGDWSTLLKSPISIFFYVISSLSVVYSLRRQFVAKEAKTEQPKKD